MTTEAVASLLEAHPFTEGFWPAHLARLAAMAASVRFTRDELIFHEGDQSSFFYVLIDGNVAVEVKAPGRPVRVSTLYRGDVLGWSSIVVTDGKQFQARALEDVHALAFDGARLRHACEEDFAFGYALMRAVVRVMANRLHDTSVQLHEVYTPVGAGK
jgi:CRP/FNR family transcriptional regulator, cyclic AMP receptor protein